MRNKFDTETIQGNMMSEMNTNQPVALKNALEIKNLNFYYGSFQGLKNINLDIAEKHVTAFIGPSGCGKSTLLRTLNRMYDLYPGQRAEGEINFYGQNILDPKQDLNLLRSRVGMIFQFAMSPYDNWVDLAWGAALLITFVVLGLNILTRVVFRKKVQS